ncbi:hypothetical protein JTB14_012356 [Gonioctena quinquepunctata]|nr:hypothetical protein JTB14_012356 [Gonioctena quinquepunctata]
MAKQTQGLTDARLNRRKAKQESTAYQLYQFGVKWEIDRLKALEEERLTRTKRIQNIDDLNSAIREKERKLWFFENEEKIELEIEEASERKVFTNTNIKAKEDIVFVPPEVSSRHSN